MYVNLISVVISWIEKFEVSNSLKKKKKKNLPHQLSLKTNTSIFLVFFFKRARQFFIKKPNPHLFSLIQNFAYFVKQGADPCKTLSQDFYFPLS